MKCVHKGCGNDVVDPDDQIPAGLACDLHRYGRWMKRCIDCAIEEAPQQWFLDDDWPAHEATDHTLGKAVFRIPD